MNTHTFYSSNDDKSTNDHMSCNTHKPLKINIKQIYMNTPVKSWLKWNLMPKLEMGKLRCQTIRYEFWFWKFLWKKDRRFSRNIFFFVSYGSVTRTLLCRFREIIWSPFWYIFGKKTKKSIFWANCHLILFIQHNFFPIPLVSKFMSENIRLTENFVRFKFTEYPINLKSYVKFSF